MKRILLALGALWFLTGGAGEIPTGPAGSGPTENPYAGDPQAIADGEKLYKRVSCHGCHSSSDQMIFNTIKFGRKGTMMSPFKDDLSDDQIWALVSYLRDLGVKRKAEGG